MSELVHTIRAEQEADPILGAFFKALYAFAERTIEMLWPDDAIPLPLITLDSVGRKDGYFVERDGLNLPRVNLNPTALRTGTDAAEVLVHELVHLKLAVSGNPTQRNYHSSEFHAELERVGILSKGRNGRHVGYVDDPDVGQHWFLWLEENNDLMLDQFMLPGMNAKKKRIMYKHTCPKCGANFRHRTLVDAKCNKCDEDFQSKRM